jgi:hypothetical protein
MAMLAAGVAVVSNGSFAGDRRAGSGVGGGLGGEREKTLRRNFLNLGI